MNRLTIILLMIACSLHGMAQYNPDKINKKAIALYDKGIEKAREDDFKEGIRLLKEAVKIDPRYADALLSMAGMYGELKNYDSAIIFYEKAKLLDTNYFKEYNLPYSINIAGKGEFDKAIKAIDDFLSISDLNESSIKAANYRKKSYQFALDYAREKPMGDYHFEPKNMGDSINSAVSEYYPTITLDGKEFVYTRRVNNYN